MVSRWSNYPLRAQWKSSTQIPPPELSARPSFTSSCQGGGRTGKLKAVRTPTTPSGFGTTSSVRTAFSEHAEGGAGVLS